MTADRDVSPPQTVARTAAPPGMSAVLVEDDEALGRLLSDNLVRWGLDVRRIDRGGEVLDEVLRRPTDLVLSDLDLPDVTGFEVAQSLRADPRTRHIPLLLISGHADTESRRAAYAAGADCFLAKPFLPRDLEPVVLSLARRGHALRHVVSVPDALDLSDELAERGGFGSRRGRRQHTARVASFALRLGLAPAVLESLSCAALLSRLGLQTSGDPAAQATQLLAERPRQRCQADVTVELSPWARLPGLGDVLTILRHRMERWDGKGGPDGLRGADIPLAALALQVCEVFDVLTSAAPTGLGLAEDEALTALTEAARQERLPPQLTETFVALQRAGELRIDLPDAGPP